MGETGATDGATGEEGRPGGSGPPRVKPVTAVVRGTRVTNSGETNRT